MILMRSSPFRRGMRSHARLSFGLALLIVISAQSGVFMGVKAPPEELSSLRIMESSVRSANLVDVPAWKVGLMMGSATPINLLLLFVPMLLILKHRSIPASFTNSIAAVVGAYKPMLIIGALIFLTVALAPYTFALSGLVFGPIVSCMCFVAYQRLFR